MSMENKAIYNPIFKWMLIGVGVAFILTISFLNLDIIDIIEITMKYLYTSFILL